MKTTFTWMFAALLICGLTISSCKKDPAPTPAPDPEPQTVTRLASFNWKNNAGAFATEACTHYIWENGVLKGECDTIDMGFFSQTYKNNMTYENGLLVRVEEEAGKWTYLYTYNDGLMKSFAHLSENDSTIWGEITAYTEDGLVEKFMSYNDFGKKTSWTLTWENGDAVTVVEDILEPEDVAGTHIYQYAYDDKPCVYTGNPLGNAIFDGDGTRVARRQSKHNLMEDGYTCTYNEKGYLISYVKENDSIFYNYIEQTLR